MGRLGTCVIFIYELDGHALWSLISSQGQHAATFGECEFSAGSFSIGPHRGRRRKPTRYSRGRGTVVVRRKEQSRALGREFRGQGKGWDSKTQPLLYTVPEVWTSSRNLQAKKFVLPEFDWISQFSVYWKIRFYRLKTWENSFCHLGEDTSSWFWSYFRAGTSHGWFSRQWLTSGDLLQP